MNIKPYYVLLKYNMKHPEEDKIYSSVDGTNKKSIVNGNTWTESEAQNNDWIITRLWSRLQK